MSIATDPIDPIDAVRVAFCHSVPTLCKRRVNRRHAVDLAGDPCWLVRYVLASNVSKICDNLPDDVLPKNIQTVTLNLLQDEEVEVRAVAAAHIAEITKKMAPEMNIADVLPVGVHDPNKEREVRERHGE